MTFTPLDVQKRVYPIWKHTRAALSGVRSRLHTVSYDSSPRPRAVFTEQTSFNRSRFRFRDGAVFSVIARLDECRRKYSKRSNKSVYSRLNVARIRNLFIVSGYFSRTSDPPPGIIYGAKNGNNGTSDTIDPFSIQVRRISPIT